VKLYVPDAAYRDLSARGNGEGIHERIGEARPKHVDEAAVVGTAHADSRLVADCDELAVG
jgi:hypothetical protein